MHRSTRPNATPASANHHHGGAVLNAANAAHTARGLVAWAVAERKREMHHGWNRVSDATLLQLLRPIEKWLEHNPTGWPASVAALWRDQQSQLRMLFPGNAAGRKKLAELEAICFNLPAR